MCKREEKESKGEEKGGEERRGEERRGEERRGEEKKNAMQCNEMMPWTPALWSHLWVSRDSISFICSQCSNQYIT